MNDRWNIAEVSTESGVGVFRYVSSKPADWDSLPLSEEISISWYYDGELPDDDTKAQMDTFEEALADLCFGAESCLTLVMTVDGLREWCFYTRDYPAFMQELNSCLAGHARYPIDIVHSHDPEWRYWHSFVDRFGAAQ